MYVSLSHRRTIVWIISLFAVACGLARDHVRRIRRAWASGGAYEQRTVIAMSVRTLMRVAIAAIAWCGSPRTHQRLASGGEEHARHTPVMACTPENFEIT